MKEQMNKNLEEEVVRNQVHSLAQGANVGVCAKSVMETTGTLDTTRKSYYQTSRRQQPK